MIIDPLAHLRIHSYSPPIASYTLGRTPVGRVTAHTPDFISVYSPPVGSTSSGIPGLRGSGLVLVDTFLGGGRLGGMLKYRLLSPKGVLGPIGVLGTLELPSNILRDSPPGLS